MFYGFNINICPHEPENIPQGSNNHTFDKEMCSSDFWEFWERVCVPSNWGKMFDVILKLGLFKNEI